MCASTGPWYRRQGCKRESMANPMKRESFMDALLVRSPAQPMLRWHAERTLRVLAYHDVADGGQFEAHMRYVAGQMYPVSADLVCEALEGGAELPRGAVLVTFDDCDRSVLERGLPVLSAFRIPAVVFVIAGVIGTEDPFWWVEVRELLGIGASCEGFEPSGPDGAVRRLKQLPNAERLSRIACLRRSVAPSAVRRRQLAAMELVQLEEGGCEIGNHTLTHPCLDRCSDAEVRVEVVRAHEHLARMGSRVPRLFAFPNGNTDPRVPALLHELGYQAAFLFDHSTNPLPASDRFAISRLRVDSTTSLDRFRTIVSGLHPAIHRIRGLS